MSNHSPILQSIVSLPGQVAGWTAHLTGWRRWGWAFVLGLISELAMAPLFIWPVLFVTFPMLVFLLDGIVSNAPTMRHRLRGAMLTGWWFGFGYFLIGLYWIGAAFLVEAEKFAVLLPFAVTLLPAGLALFYGLATALAAVVWRAGLSRVLLLAFAFWACEWLRGHILTGLPWNSLGYALTGNIYMMQSAALVGSGGLTLFAVLIFTSPAVLLDPRDTSAGGRRGGILFVTAMVSLLALVHLYGMARLSAKTTFIAGPKLRIVQPNIAQTDKWNPALRRSIFDRHLSTSVVASNGRVDNLAGITHLIWPEAALPFLILQSPKALEEIAAMLPDGVVLIMGGLRAERQQNSASQSVGSDGKLKFYNSIFALDHNAQTLAVYDKQHLVPFGEYLPFQNALEMIGLEQLTRLRGGFETGSGTKQMQLTGLPELIALICYEVIFSGEVFGDGEQNPSDKPAQWLLNVTNDGWFGNTSGPHQHFHHARVRAVEYGLPLVRAANTGISAVIDPYGRVLQKLGVNQTGTLDFALPNRADVTVYSRFSWLISVVIVILGIATVARIWQRS